ncbi:MAG: dUTP diphosphatase [Bacteroidales bacterium]|uniref:dUTP diphosphatase n=1 Tax=Candidatus Cryptobacteroides sp. TaxID=2952915 RepID=UPI002A759B80|nr:dUTP diphosphatase [Candidatus Cryptobacteroides sp.]MBS7277509.1 dUTP diphosphatase [Bacteroidales bacterium]MCI6527139.1 dUTP diphosphatase [Bacteroidales bacterium]MDD5915031.1 dUTP diphosphatase [Bacteroidales bacterium]MDD7136154.1 dUTP diphosphatase [Bacteroidales bacterium]MDD7234535.1 dUTP diphosphatase [Bacteroidales bacterium]
MKVKIVNKSQWPDPAYATVASAGMDLRADIAEPVVLKPLERRLVPTGIFIELPAGYEAQVRPRSGLATKHGVTVINSPGTVDADYRGELKVSLVNLSSEPFEIVPGERIAQMVVAAHETVEWEKVEALSETERGAGGWGSTGAK